MFKYKEKTAFTYNFWFQSFLQHKPGINCLLAFDHTTDFSKW